MLFSKTGEFNETAKITSIHPPLDELGLNSEKEHKKEEYFEK